MNVVSCLNGSAINFIGIDGPNKGKNSLGNDVFWFTTSYQNGIVPYNYGTQNPFQWFAGAPSTRAMLTALWILTFDNADYLKIDSLGKCNNSDIILDGVTNTSCH